MPRAYGSDEVCNFRFDSHRGSTKCKALVGWRAANTGCATQSGLTGQLKVESSFLIGADYASSCLTLQWSCSGVVPGGLFTRQGSQVRTLYHPPVISPINQALTKNRSALSV